MTDKILIVCAHPDDEILGCSATVARFIQEGYEASTLIIGEMRGLSGNTIKANKIIGINNVEWGGVSDNQFDKITLLRIIQFIERVIERLKPHTVFTHFRNDLNIDHRLTYQAVLTATRPMVDQSVKIVYSFEVMSSTEWNYPLSFSPNVFFDVSETIEKKINAMKEYKTELKEFPHPRSLEAIEINSIYWGTKVGLKHAEAFEMVRAIC